MLIPNYNKVLLLFATETLESHDYLMLKNTDIKNTDSYIATPEQLQDFVDSIANADVLAIDTEFMREKTYYPQLCLLQFATKKRCVIVDPLAISDLQALKPLLSQKQTVKVFHAGAQDLEIIYQKLGIVPEPIFDTQIAAEFLGISQQTSLSTIVHSYCDIKLDKSDSLTDWAARPLTQTQIHYAWDDVRYLPQIYLQMKAKLEELGRISWVQEDFEALGDEEKYKIVPEKCWMRVKHSSKLSHKQLGVLQEIAACRERIAIRRNMPRKWIISDELLIEIARVSPQSLAELHHLRGAKNQLGDSWGQELLQAVKQGLKIKHDQLPERKGVVIKNASHIAAHDLMRALLNQRARDNHVSQSILANKDDLVHLANGQREGIKILEGWRYQIVGSELLELLKGNLALRLDVDQVEVMEKLEPQTMED